MHLLIPEIVKARRDDLLQEAQHERLLRKARPAERSLLARTLAGIGGFLIAAGQKLQDPYIKESPNPLIPAPTSRPLAKCNTVYVINSAGRKSTRFK